MNYFIQLLVLVVYISLLASQFLVVSALGVSPLKEKNDNSLYTKCGFSSDTNFQTWYKTLSTNSPVLFPSSEEDLSQIVQKVAENGCRVRVRGSGHSEDGVVMQKADEDDDISDIVVVNLVDLVPHEDWNEVLSNTSANGPTIKMSAGASVLKMISVTRPKGFLPYTAASSALFSLGGLYLNPSTHGQGYSQGRLAPQVVGLRVLKADGTFKEFTSSDPELIDFRGSLGLLGIVTALEIRLRPDTGFDMKKDSFFLDGLEETKFKKFIKSKLTDNDGTQFFYNVYDDVLDTHEFHFDGDPSFNHQETTKYYKDLLEKFPDTAFTGGQLTNTDLFEISSDLVSTKRDLAESISRITRQTISDSIDENQKKQRDGLFTRMDKVPQFESLFYSIKCSEEFLNSTTCLEELYQLITKTRKVLSDIEQKESSDWYPTLALEARLFSVKENEIALEHLSPGTYIGLENLALRQQNNLAYSKYHKEIEEMWRQDFPGGGIHHGKPYGFDSVETFGEDVFYPFQNDDLLDSIYSEDVKRGFLKKMDSYDPQGIFRAGSTLRLLGVTEEKYIPQRKPQDFSIPSSIKTPKILLWVEIVALCSCILSFVATYGWYRHTRYTRIVKTVDKYASRIGESSLIFEAETPNTEEMASPALKSMKLRRFSTNSHHERTKQFSRSLNHERSFLSKSIVEASEAIYELQDGTDADNFEGNMLEDSSNYKVSNNQERISCLRRLRSSKFATSLKEETQEDSIVETDNWQDTTFDKNLPIIQIDDLHFFWNDQRGTIIRTDHFWLGGCKLTAIQGASGMGKSTFMKILAGFCVPHMTIEATSVLKPKIVMCPQAADMWPDEMLVRDVLLFACILYGSDQDESAKTFLHLGVFDLFELKFGSLSGGQKQLINIVTTILCPTPSVILLDEPLASLDEEKALLLVRALRNISSKHSFVITAHMVNSKVHAEFDRIVQFGGSGSDGFTSTCQVDKDYFVNEMARNENHQGSFKDGVLAMIVLWHAQFSSWPLIEVGVLFASIVGGVIVGLILQGLINFEEIISFQNATNISLYNISALFGIMFITSFSIPLIYGERERKMITNFASQNILLPTAYLTSVIIRCVFFGGLQALGWYSAILPLAQFDGDSGIMIAVGAAIFSASWCSLMYLLIQSLQSTYASHAVVIACVYSILFGGIYRWEALYKPLQVPHYFMLIFYFNANDVALIFDEMETGCNAGFDVDIDDMKDMNSLTETFTSMMRNLCAPGRIVYDEIGLPQITSLQAQGVALLYALISCFGIWYIMRKLRGKICLRK